MDNHYNFNLTIDECKLILDNIKGLVVIDENKNIKFISNDMVRRILSLGGKIPEGGPSGHHIDVIHPSSKISRAFDPEAIDNDLISVYVLNGAPNVARIKPLYKDGELMGAIDYDLLYGYSDFKSFFSQADRYLFFLEDIKAEYLDAKANKKRKYNISDIIGKSDAIKELKQKIYKVAETESTVLVTGETGCGKEMITHSIHNLSRRAKNPFIEVNCAAIPESLAESELFGYEEGSFTGAIKGGKPGKFELANKGTIFLDEIDQLAYYLQPKLLRVLQEREISRIGGTVVPVDVRVIAATNKNLLELVKKGKFREDLYYRLNVIDIEVPPLRERKEDIPLLANEYLNRIKNVIGKNISGISDNAMKLLINYSWPGNVRELFNVIEKGVNMSNGGELELTDFRNFVSNSGMTEVSIVAGFDSSLDDFKELAEKEAIIKVLKICENNRSKAAEYLKITRQCLYKKMKKYKIYECKHITTL